MEERDRQFGMNMYTLLLGNQYGPTYSTENSAQCYVAAWMGGDLGGRMDPCICMAESLCCLPETITTLLIGHPPKQNKKLKKEKAQALDQQGYYFIIILYCTALE